MGAMWKTIGRGGTVLVRPARLDDGPALQRIDVNTRTEEVSPAPPSPPDRSFFGTQSRPEDVLVAEVDTAVAGYVELGPQYSLPSSSHVLEVKGLAVDPGRQGTGIGPLLVQAAIQSARTRGARRLTLHVLASNAVALRLYERCGFVIEGVQRAQFWLSGRYVDDVLLALDLTCHDALAQTGREA
jgi:ribosomal protein S18 acetylase RimI-like enzyme